MKKIIIITMAIAAITSATVLTSCSDRTPTPQEEAERMIANHKAKPADTPSPIFENYYNLIENEKGINDCIGQIKLDNTLDEIRQKKAEAYQIVEDYFKPLLAKEKESVENKTDIPFEFDKEYFSDAEIRINNISERQVEFSGTFTFIPLFSAMRPNPYAAFLKSDGTPVRGKIYDSRFRCKFERIEGDKYSYHFTMPANFDYIYFINGTEKIKLENIR